jgi:hypothetical protein
LPQRLKKLAENPPVNKLDFGSELDFWDSEGIEILILDQKFNKILTKAS